MLGEVGDSTLSVLVNKSRDLLSKSRYMHLSRDPNQAHLVEKDSGIHKIDTADLLSVDIEQVKQVDPSLKPCRYF